MLLFGPRTLALLHRVDVMYPLPEEKNGTNDLPLTLHYQLPDSSENSYKSLKQHAHHSAQGNICDSRATPYSGRASIVAILLKSRTHMLEVERSSSSGSGSRLKEIAVSLSGDVSYKVLKDW